MHSIRQNKVDGTWRVVRFERVGNDDTPVAMFSRMSFVSALRLVNILNGGPGDVPAASNVLQAWEMCACES